VKITSIIAAVFTWFPTGTLNSTEMCYLGIGQIALDGTDPNSTVTMGNYTFTRYFTTAYNYQFVTKGCYYHDPQNGWMSDGVYVR
jgi:hypothetical protein